MIPGQKYLLKFASRHPTTNVIVNNVVLECEFIHNYDDTYRNAYIEYHNMVGEDAVMPDSLMENIYDENENHIDHPFDHPLYPYKYYEKFFQNNNVGIGLFRVLRLVSTRFKGVPGKGAMPNKFEKDPYSYVSISGNSVINTGSKIIMGQTLMWVNLSKCEIISKLNIEKMWQEKATDKLDLLPELKETIKGYYGRAKRTKKHTKKTPKNKKLKRKTMKHK